MGKVWKLQDAKNRFSEVVNEAIHKGPQTVTRRGVEAVVVVSSGAYKKLSKPSTNLVEFFRKSPLRGAGIDLERSKEPSREVYF